MRMLLIKIDFQKFLLNTQKKKTETCIVTILLIKRYISDYNVAYMNQVVFPLTII